MTIRWMELSEIEDLVNPVIEKRGWASLNLNEETPTCRVLGAFGQDGELIEFFALQLYPVLGPMCRVDNSIRDAGETSRELAHQMYDFLKETDARDFLVVANSPVSERLAERFGMKTLAVPVYVNHTGSEIREHGEQINDRS